MYCPGWILAVLCNEVSRRYVLSELPISAFAKKFSEKAIDHYEDLQAPKLEAGAEAIIRFLGEVEEVDIETVCSSFTYNTICFERDGSPRKQKGFLIKKDAIAPSKIEANHEDVIKLFRAFVFRLRSNPNLKTPSGWEISSVEDFEWLGTIVNQDVSFLDGLN